MTMSKQSTIRQEKAFINRFLVWEKKGYTFDGNFGNTKEEAETRAMYLRSVGYKARAFRGMGNTYAVLRTNTKRRK